jgi:UDP-N-acetylmuramate dehydrogenase
MNIQKNVSLKEHNTFGIDKKAKYFTQVSSIQEVIKSIEEAEKLEVPLLVLGGGSNILLTKDVEALVMKMNIKGIHLVNDTKDHGYVKVGAGEVWHDFVLHAIRFNWAGIENLSLIPGTVGASPMQNIGAYGVEIREVFHSLEAVNIQSKKTETFDHAACKFGYRDSIFKNEAKGKYIITHVTFRLNKNASFNTSYGAIRSTLDQMDVKELSLEAISQAVMTIRQSKLPDPKAIGNAGSFFKNPTLEHGHYLELKKRYPTIPGFENEGGVKVPAAWLLEQAGWKGKTFDKVGVHKDQPLVLVNYGGGDGEAIRHLSDAIREDIQAKFNIILQPEVNFI